MSSYTASDEIHAGDMHIILIKRLVEEAKPAYAGFAFEGRLASGHYMSKTWKLPEAALTVLNAGPREYLVPQSMDCEWQLLKIMLRKIGENAIQPHNLTTRGAHAACQCEVRKRRHSRRIA